MAVPSAVGTATTHASTAHPGIDGPGQPDEECRKVVTTVPTAQIPRAIHRPRRNAETRPQRPSRFLGRHIGFFWDDPTRLVDIDPGDLAGEEAPA
ncbi:hypothetical protein IQ62_08525 [Streptomyces scabiei]|uniref:hypothetical protein n=1 Tax=Streptomyces scabiei TaxID=1930 RepID=UPI0004E6C61C|nr:hypothetical protein IQ62_08525 [Streptomyces scabiei]